MSEGELYKIINSYKTTETSLRFKLKCHRPDSEKSGCGERESREKERNGNKYIKNKNALKHKI